MTDSKGKPHRSDDPRVEDPGSYIGTEPEREAETIPGGVGPKDQRVSGSDSRPGADGEPEDSSDG